MLVSWFQDKIYSWLSDKQDFPNEVSDPPAFSIPWYLAFGQKAKSKKQKRKKIIKKIDQKSRNIRREVFVVKERLTYCIR